MSIDIPNLDDLSYEQLIDELVRSIPNYSSNWTDFNQSDPGITILQLISWVGESLLYQANSISDQSYYNYLKLLAGTQTYRPNDRYQQALLTALEDWPQESEPGFDQCGQPRSYPKARTQAQINEIEAVAQAYWQVNNRAIAEVDYYSLGLEAYFQTLAELTHPSLTLTDDQLLYRQQSLEQLQALRRLFITPQSRLSPSSTQQWIEIVVNIAADLPAVMTQAEPDQAPEVTTLITAIKNFIVPRRPVGTLIKVHPAHYTNIDLWVAVQITTGSNSQTVSQAIQQQIDHYVSSVSGGRNNTGWSLGEPLISFDLIHLIGEVNGVELVINIALQGYQFVQLFQPNKPTLPLPKDQWLITKTIAKNNAPEKQWAIIKHSDNPSSDPIAFDDFIIQELIGNVQATVTTTHTPQNQRTHTQWNIGGVNET